MERPYVSLRIVKLRISPSTICLPLDAERGSAVIPVHFKFMFRLQAKAHCKSSCVLSLRFEPFHLAGASLAVLQVSRADCGSVQSLSGLMRRGEQLVQDICLKPILECKTHFVIDQRGKAAASNGRVMLGLHLNQDSRSLDQPDLSMSVLFVHFHGPELHVQGIGKHPSTDLP